MFSLVNDVESYPQFLPWCSSARVLQRDQDSMVASLDMARVRLDVVDQAEHVLR